MEAVHDFQNPLIKMEACLSHLKSSFNPLIQLSSGFQLHFLAPVTHLRLHHVTATCVHLRRILGTLCSFEDGVAVRGNHVSNYTVALGRHMHDTATPAIDAIGGQTLESIYCSFRQTTNRCSQYNLVCFVCGLAKAVDVRQAVPTLNICHFYHTSAI